MVALLGAAALAFAGCGPGTSQVTGLVKYNDKALPDGDIILEPADGKGKPAFAKIKDGAFSLAVSPGPKKVKINASRPGKVVDPLMGAAAPESYIPKEYNSETTLTAEITSGKQDPLAFNLKGPS